MQATTRPPKPSLLRLLFSSFGGIGLVRRGNRARPPGLPRGLPTHHRRPAFPENLAGGDFLTWNFSPWQFFPPNQNRDGHQTKTAVWGLGRCVGEARGGGRGPASSHDGGGGEALREVVLRGHRGARCRPARAPPRPPPPRAPAREGWEPQGAAAAGDDGGGARGRGRGGGGGRGMTRRSPWPAGPPPPAGRAGAGPGPRRGGRALQRGRGQSLLSLGALAGGGPGGPGGRAAARARGWPRPAPSLGRASPAPRRASPGRRRGIFPEGWGFLLLLGEAGRRRPALGSGEGEGPRN